MTYDPGDVLIGSNTPYFEHMDGDGTHIESVHTIDDLGFDAGQWGITFDKRNVPYICLNPIGDVGNDHSPHDLVWIPDDSGLLVIVCVSDGVAELWKYDLDGVFVRSWTGLDVDTTWDHQKLKVDIACDSRTVYYTDQGQTIFKYDLVDEVNLTPFLTATPPGNYNFCAFKLYKNGSIVVALTEEGTGPRNAICLTPEGKLWTDEINPVGDYNVYRRATVDGTYDTSHVVDFNGTNDEVLALGCAFNKCAGAIRRPFGVVIS